MCNSYKANTETIMDDFHRHIYSFWWLINCILIPAYCVKKICCCKKSYYDMYASQGPIQKSGWGGGKSKFRCAAWISPPVPLKYRKNSFWEGTSNVPLALILYFPSFLLYSFILSLFTLFLDFFVSSCKLLGGGGNNPSNLAPPPEYAPDHSVEGNILLPAL